MSNKEIKVLGWQIEQTKSLLESVAKNEKQTLSKVFEKWAKDNARQTFSVRNYYYKLVDLLKKDCNLQKILGINENLFKKEMFSRHFSQNQSVWLLENILPNQPKSSVRSRCFELAKGNISKMIRFQNKYRNLVGKEKELVKSVILKLQKQGIQTRNPFEKNITKPQILTMPKQKNIIDDIEIQALFNGLLKLVKSNTERAVNLKNQQDSKLKENTLQVALTNLRKKDVLIYEMDSENKKLKDTLSNTQKKLLQLKEKNISTIKQLQEIEKSQKMEELKLFIEKLSVGLEEKFTQPEN